MGLLKQKKNTKEIEDTEVVKEYTEHEAVATFTDDSTKEYTFDHMSRSSNSIKLSDYVFEDGSYKKRAFATIPHDNLKDFETVKRTKKAIVKKEMKTIEVDEDGNPIEDDDEDEENDGE